MPEQKLEKFLFLLTVRIIFTVEKAVFHFMFCLSNLHNEQKLDFF